MATLVEIYRMHARGEYELAIIEAEERLKGMTCSRDGRMWVKLNCIVGDALLDLKRFAEAEARFDSVWTQCRHPVALANRGYAKWRQVAYEAAFKDVMAALKTNEGSDIEVGFRNAIGIAMDMNRPDIVSPISKEYHRRFGRTNKMRQLLKDFSSRYPEFALDPDDPDQDDD